MAFDAVSWYDPAKANVSWDSVSWNDVSWQDVSWNDVSWQDVSWDSVSWQDVSWNDVSTADSGEDVSWEDAAEGDANSSDGVELTDDQLAQIICDPTVNPDPIPEACTQPADGSGTTTDGTTTDPGTTTDRARPAARRPARVTAAAARPTRARARRTRARPLLPRALIAEGAGRLDRPAPSPVRGIFGGVPQTGDAIVSTRWQFQPVRPVGGRCARPGSAARAEARRQETGSRP